MFVYDFLQVETPFDEVREHFARGADWLAPLAQSACREGQATVVALGLRSRLGAIDKEVEIELDEPLLREDIVVVPVRWRATGAPLLFPAMDGQLEICRLGRATHVSLLGNYTPPGGSLGRLVDRTVLHHVAEAGVRSFLGQLAREISSPVRAGATNEPAPS